MSGDQKESNPMLEYYEPLIDGFWPMVRLILLANIVSGLFSALDNLVQLYRVFNQPQGGLAIFLTSSYATPFIVIACCELCGSVISTIACLICVRARRGRLVILWTTAALMAVRTVRFAMTVAQYISLYSGRSKTPQHSLPVVTIQLAIGLFGGFALPLLIIAALTRPRVRQLFDR